jgi:hypothetical protein
MKEIGLETLHHRGERICHVLMMAFSSSSVAHCPPSFPNRIQVLLEKRFNDKDDGDQCKSSGHGRSCQTWDMSWTRNSKGSCEMCDVFISWNKINRIDG